MASPTIDGHAATAPTGGTSQSVTLTTTLANDIVYLCVYQEPPSGSTPRTVVSVTGGGLTWALRAAASHPVTTQSHMELWWALAPAPLTAVAITATVTAPATDDWVLIACGVHGCASPTAPFDTNATLPATAFGVNGGGVPTAVVSTSQPDDLILAWFGDLNNGDQTNIPAGFTLVDSAGTSSGANFACAGLGVLSVSALQSALAVAWGRTGTGSILFLDALTADSSASTPLPMMLGRVRDQLPGARMHL